MALFVNHDNVAPGRQRAAKEIDRPDHAVETGLRSRPGCNHYDRRAVGCDRAYVGVCTETDIDIETFELAFTPRDEGAQLVLPRERGDLEDLAAKGVSFLVEPHGVTGHGTGAGRLETRQAAPDDDYGEAFGLALVSRWLRLESDVRVLKTRDRELP